jgi:energy-coupling factor transporter ATP-binding protein EcfA2
MLEEDKKLRENPYKYIQDYADMRLAVVGGKAFKRLCLLPLSLFLPDISSNIISNMSALILGDSGCGKSSLCQMYSPLCYNPLIRRVITEADLIETVSEQKWTSIIIEDLTQSVTNEGYGLIKVLEGITGEERSVSKSTLRKEFTGEVKGVGLFGITPQDLERFAKDFETGLLSRCILVLITLKKEDYKTIAEFITYRAGDSKYIEEWRKKEDVIIDFYEELKMIARGKHKEYLINKYGKDNKERIIEPVKGYSIDEKFKKELLRKWNRISDNMLSQGYTPNNRELSAYYKFLVSLAFLNIHNRKCENGILSPNEEDHKIALNLAIENLKWKWAIPIALKYNRRASSLEILEKIINNGIPEVVREVLINISPYGKQLKEF